MSSLCNWLSLHQNQNRLEYQPNNISQAEYNSESMNMVWPQKSKTIWSSQVGFKFDGLCKHFDFNDINAMAFFY